MLALTHDATQTIEGLLAEPGIPDGAGVRIAHADSENASAPSALQVGMAAAPAEDDEVIEEAGARVFVEDALAEFLGDKVLDVDRQGNEVRFSLIEQP